MPDLFKTDLALARRGANLPTSDREAVDLRAAGGDLQTVDGRANLVQSLLNRLYTRQGALAALGHPRYGSRLHLLVGEPDTRRTRARAELYIREALAADPRVGEIAGVAFETAPRASALRSALLAHVTVLPADGGAPLSLAVTAGLEG